MNRKTTKKVLKAATISIISLIVGYLLMTIPFHLFETLSDTQMRVVFYSEIIIYFAIGATYILIKEKKQAKKKEQSLRRYQRKISAEKSQNSINEIFSTVYFGNNVA